MPDRGSIQACCVWLQLLDWACLFVNSLLKFYNIGTHWRQFKKTFWHNLSPYWHITSILTAIDINYTKKFYKCGTWCQCYKTNTAIIYCNFRLNYRSIFITLNLPWNGGKLLWYDGKLMCDFNPRKSRVKVAAVIYRGNLPQYFYNTGPWCQCYKTNTAIIHCNFRLNYWSNFYNYEFTFEWQ